MRDRILAEIKKLGEKLGKPPTLVQLHRECKISWHQVYKHFRGMRAAIRAAGLEPGFRGGGLLDERTLVLDWARVVRELGRLPQRAEYSARGKHHAVTLHDRVGWHQVAHRFALMLREFHIENEWRDVEEIVLRKYPLLERTIHGSAISLQPMDIRAAERKDRAVRPLGHRPMGDPGPQRMRLGRVVATALAIEILMAAERSTSAAEAASPIAANADLHPIKPTTGLLGTPVKPCSTPLVETIVPADVRAERGIAATAEETEPEAQGERRVEKRGQGRTPVYGEPLALAAMAHAPMNEDGVLFLFGAVAADMGFRIERVQREFPDVEAKREVAPGIWELQFWELEWLSRNFKEHKHDPKGCRGIICWKHNWPDVPEGLEVIELSKVVKGR